MKENQIPQQSPAVSFASLYGMSDYIAFALGKIHVLSTFRSTNNYSYEFLANAGYKSYKYLPYGPIEVLQPYLFRRAQENRSIFEKAAKDRQLHFKALKSRLSRRDS